MAESVRGGEGRAKEMKRKGREKERDRQTLGLTSPA